MKLNRTLRLLILAAATAAAGTAVAAQATTTTSAATAATPAAAPAPAPAGKHWYHGHRAVLVRIMLRATRQLDLTAEQQQTIRGILSAARSQRAGSAPPVDLTVLANPGDPNYAAALQTVKSRAQSRLQKEIELQGQIYNVLTADQKARLPQVLGDLKTKAAQRRGASLDRERPRAGPV